jgi:hypothetical protein
MNFLKASIIQLLPLLQQSRKQLKGKEVELRKALSLQKLLQNYQKNILKTLKLLSPHLHQPLLQLREVR